MSNIEMFLLYSEHYTPEIKKLYDDTSEYCPRQRCYGCAVRKPCDKFNSNTSPILSDKDIIVLKDIVPELFI
jgi:hypothetical protein